MVKKIAKISFEVLFVGLCLLIVLQSTSIFIDATERLKDIVEIRQVKNYFENFDAKPYLDSYVKAIEEFVAKVVELFEKEDFWTIVGKFLDKIWNFILDAIIYFCNFGVTILFVLWIILHEAFSKEEPNIKYTRGAKIYLKYLELKHRFFNWVKLQLIRPLHLLSDNKRAIVLHIAILLLARGYLYRFLIEVILFIEVYFIRLFNAELYLTMFDILKFLLIQVVEFLKILPTPILILLILLLIFFNALSRANYRLRKNHERLKKFAKEDITQTTFINGPPGSGKTLLNTSLSLISEENYIDELEDNMMDIEIVNPNKNYAESRLESSNDDYSNFYQIERKRSTFLTSNYSIYSPYFMSYSKIFDFDNMRKNKKLDRYALEEYIVISISELDKEYNSHDNMKDVGADGAATFFSTVSHDLKRHVKIFCDYQLKDQVPLRIRGNSEYFLTIQNRRKKYPFLLYLYFLPFIGIDKLLKAYIGKYESKRNTITKKTERRSYSIFKRNDYSLLYAFLRQWIFINSKIIKFFDHYWFFKIKCDLSIRDGEKGEDKILNLNLCDLEINDHKLYDSTFLSYAYEVKKNYMFKDLDSFTSLTPPVEELTKCNSRFYNKINNIESIDDSVNDETNADLTETIIDID